MHIELVYIVLLLGHIIGDFYLQSDNMATSKKEKYCAVVLHSISYALSVMVIVLLCIPQCTERTWLLLSIGVSHFAIDSIKYIIDSTSCTSLCWLRKNIFIIDQAIHFALISVFWFCFGKDIDVRWFIAQEMVHLPDLPIKIILGILCVIRPIGIWISSSSLRNYYQTDSSTSSGSIKNAGKTIGYLERIIVLTFLMYQQFGAIAFVLTAKSVARFKAIEHSQYLAEYYLIGTLMSVVSTMMVAVFLGLVQ